MKLQQVLSKEEMLVVGESLYHHMKSLERMKKEQEDRGSFGEKEQRTHELKYKQIEDVWKKVMKGWVASLTGIMVQPVMTKD
jgi:hypothetical protein